MKQRTCRLGLIGAGRIGKLHAENIHTQLPQFRLLAISDPNLDVDWANSLAIPIKSKTIDAIISHPDIDAILIASPSHLHVEQIKAASSAGKAILCEKPIGLIDSEIQTTLQMVSDNNTLLQIGFNRRFDPSFAAIQMRVQSGDIGLPHIIRITSRDPKCPSNDYCATSGGIFMDMSIHDFDMARFLTGAEVVEVYASGAVLINPDFDALNDVDTAIIQLRFTNGALCVIDNSRQAVYGYDQRIEVFGERGMLLAENHLGDTVKYYSCEHNQQTNPLHFFLERYQQAYILELRAFYDAWLNKKPSPVSGWDGLQALRIAHAARRSLETKLPVYLD